MGCHRLLPALAGVFFTTNATGEVLSGYQKQRIVEFRPFLMLLWIVERDRELNHGTQRFSYRRLLPTPSKWNFILFFKILLKLKKILFLRFYNF